MNICCYKNPFTRLTRLNVQGNWRYLDGTPVTYFRWKYKNSVQTGPKATAADSKDCMKLVKSAGWFDHNFCNRNSGSDSTDFLCERKPTCGSTGSITFGFGKKQKTESKCHILKLEGQAEGQEI